MSHVFISYVRDNSALVLKLRDVLQAHRVEVWLDRDRIKPGEWWEEAIRKAISEGLFFIACFSREYQRRSEAYMNEELTLAIDVLRRRPFNQIWFIPVVLDEECEVPDIGIGRGKTLHSINWVEIYGDKWDDGVRRMLSVVAPTPSPGTIFRDKLKDGSQGPEMVTIPAGELWMGLDEALDSDAYKSELPRHRVIIAKGFALGRYPVTFDEYDRFARATDCELPSDQDWGRGNRPVINVSWDDATAYTEWLSTQTGKRYRLPTEAEWEYAARAGTETRYWWGNEIGRNKANCDGCGSQWDNQMTAPVGSFEANPFGLYDTAGNVLEWVEDCWHGSYKGAPDDGTAWISGGDCKRRVLRGGSWFGNPNRVRSANRSWHYRVYRTSGRGFRLAQDL